MVSEFCEIYFWRLLEECLLRFHYLNKLEAQQKIGELQARLGAESISDLIYHSEPFELACELSGVTLDPDVHWEKYQNLVLEMHTLVSGNFPENQAALSAPIADQTVSTHPVQSPNS